jgi:chromodomain-helicase-DNA-binding protein 7
MVHLYRDAYYRYDPTAPRGMGPPPGYSSHPPRHRAPIPLQQQQPQYPSYQPTDNMYSMGTDQHAGMSLGDITGWGSQPVPPQPYGQPMGYGHPAPQPPQRQTQARYDENFPIKIIVLLIWMLSVS